MTLLRKVSYVENLRNRRQCKEYFEVFPWHTNTQSNGMFECYCDVRNVIYVLSSQAKVFT